MHEYSTKPCTKCGVPKPLSEFHKDRHAPDGHTFRCKSCICRGPRAADTYYFNNSGVCRICGKGSPEVEFGIDHGTKLGISTICKSCKSIEGFKHRSKHREKIRATGAARVQRIRLEVLLHYGGMPPMCACCGESHLEFLAIDHIGGGGRKHVQEIRKTAGKRLHVWLRDSGFPGGFRVLCHNCNLASKEGRPCPHVDPKWMRDFSEKGPQYVHRQAFRENRRLTILRHYGGDPPSCACCGENHLRFLAIDHIDGGGYQHMKREGGLPLDYLLWRDGLPSGYRILCHNCNMARGFYGRCPHEA